MVPYHCGALLPDEQRETSAHYRRFRRFNRYQLGLEEGAELIAFVEMVGIKAAGYIFGWVEQPSMFRAYKAIASHPPMVELARVYRERNDAAMDEATGLAVLAMMVRGGFRRGSPPVLVQRTLQSLRRQGWKHGQIAARVGVSARQVMRWTAPPSLKPLKVHERAGLQLLIG